MRSVWTVENIQKFLDENTDGIKFISKEYVDKGYQNCLYVTLLLPDGTTKKVLWNRFRAKENKNVFVKRWTQEEAFSFCQEHGFYPIEGAIFKNVDSTFPCRSNDGFIYLVSITNLKRHLKNESNFHIIKNNPYVLENIRLYCKKYRPDYEFLENEVGDVRKEYRFRYNGPLDNNIPREFSITLDYFINGGGGIKGLNISHEADKVAGILRKYKVDFSLEKTFPDLLSYGGRASLRFDFAVYNEDKTLKCLIEYDSILHFERVEYFHHKNSDYLAAAERDRRKNSYCLAHNIPLYRIPYWDLNSISTLDDIFSESHRVRSKFHNDYLKPP